MRLFDLRAAAGAMERGKPRSRTSMARAQSALLFAGGALALVAIALPHPPDLNQGAYAVIAAIAIAGGALTAAIGPRLPTICFQALTAAGTLLITASIY